MRDATINRIRVEKGGRYWVDPRRLADLRLRSRRVAGPVLAEDKKGVNCPVCGRELVRLGNAKSGMWMPGKIYRCTHCQAGANRFTMDRQGKPVAQLNYDRLGATTETETTKLAATGSPAGGRA